MEKKQIMILILILAILLAGTALKILIQKKDPQTVPGPQFSGALAFQFEPATVERILLRRTAKTPQVELVKVNGRWEIKSLWGAIANEGKVISFLEKIRDIRWEPRAAGGKFFADFGIDHAEAFSIRLTGAENSPILDVRVGTKPAGRDGYFLRKASGDEVYFTDTNMAELLGIFTAFNEAAPLSGYWANLALFNIPIDRVLSVVMKPFAGGKEQPPVLGIRREVTGDDPSKNPWSFIKEESPAKTVDPEKVLRLLVALNSVQAQAVVDPNGQDYGLGAPVLEIAVTEKDRGEVRVTVGPKNAKEDVYYVKVSDRPEVFKLSANDFADLDMKDEQLLKEIPAAKAPPKAP